ncbi:MAG: hypothetical protein N3D09_04950 [Archaeoglobaceae archaeon]|nr:hypothetical protein [Archaeoglobaceae archaeon]
MLTERSALMMVFIGSILTLASPILTTPLLIDLVDEHYFSDKIVIRGYVGEHGGFEPKVLKLTKGCHKIVFMPMDIAQGLAIDELKVDTGVVIPGEKRELEVCFNKSGVYLFRNSVSSGPMTPFQIGYIVVEGYDP